MCLNGVFTPYDRGVRCWHHEKRETKEWKTDNHYKGGVFILFNILCNFDGGVGSNTIWNNTDYVFYASLLNS